MDSKSLSKINENTLVILRNVYEHPFIIVSRIMSCTISQDEASFPGLGGVYLGKKRVSIALAHGFSITEYGFRTENNQKCGFFSYELNITLYDTFYSPDN